MTVGNLTIVRVINITLKEIGSDLRFKTKFRAQK